MDLVSNGKCNHLFSNVDFSCFVGFEIQNNSVVMYFKITVFFPLFKFNILALGAQIVAWNGQK